MSATAYPAHTTFYTKGYFDHSLLNVPEAQDRIVYAGYTSLDDALGLNDPSTPPPSPKDELTLLREYNHLAARKRVAVKMDWLDDGSGSLKGSGEFVEILATRLDADVVAREASLRREHLTRLYGDESPHRVERAMHGYRPVPACAEKVRYCVDAPQPLFTGKEAQRTVRNPTPILEQELLPTPPPPPPSLEYIGTGAAFSYEGLYPTATLLQCEPIPREPEPAELPPCIDPIYLDASAWHTDYRKEGLQIMLGTSYVFPRTDVLAPGACNLTPKKRAAASRKVAKVQEKTKAAVKKATVSRKSKPAKPVQTHTARRNSLANRASMLVY